MALWPKPHPPTGYEPNVTDTSDEFEAIPSFFQISNFDTIYDLGDNDAASTDAEIDDGHIRCALALPLFSQESEAEANLRQTHLINAEGLFKGAPSNLARTGKPVVWLTQKRKCSQDLDDSKIRITRERHCSRKPNPKSWDMSTKRMMPKTKFVH